MDKLFTLDPSNWLHCGYDLIFTRPCTVSQFIDYVLSEYSEMFGYIRISLGGSYNWLDKSAPEIKFCNGEVTSNSMPQEYLNKQIAYGVVDYEYYNMKFNLLLKEYLNEN